MESRLKVYQLKCKKTSFCPVFLGPLQVNDFIKFLGNMSTSYRSENVLITMGEDFNYQSAHMWFKNLDKLIK